MQATHSQLRQWDRQIVWHAFTQMAEYEPCIIDRAYGCTLVDIDGREYLDGVSSLWCNVHGHCHPTIDAAVRRQLDQVAHVSLLGLSNSTTIQLAQRLVQLAPPGLEHVFFSSDGACGVEVALKMAFQYWRQCAAPQPHKSTYIAFDCAYHGDTLGAVSVGGVARFHQLFRPLLFDVLRLPAPDMYRLPAAVTRQTACEFFLDRLRDVLAQHHRRVAALVMEPLVQAAAGMIMHPRGFLSGVRRLTREFDVLLIVDEVAVGMGRTGRMFACEHEAVSPDFLCLGKGLSGGYLPMAATLTTDAVWQAFLGRHDQSRTLYHGHTYGGNPLGAAPALATLDVFHQEQTLERLPEKMNRLASHLARLADLPHVGDARQCGMMGAVELVMDRQTRQPYPWQERRGAAVCAHALAEGVWLRPLGDVIVIMPPLAITLPELDRICTAVGRGIELATRV